MNNITFKSLSLLFAFLLITLSACEEDNQETCDETPLSQCPSADISTCCPDEGDCYYIYNGVEYSSVDDIVDLCNPSASVEQANLIRIELDDYTKYLIQEARQAAICQ